MLGIILIAIARVFGEIAASIEKYEASHKKETIYAMGFLNGFWSTIFLLLFGLFRGSFIFSFASLPTLVIRIVLELILMFVALHALMQAERSTFSFLRILTIPLLLGVDLVLGYSLSISELAGVSLIVIALVFLLMNHGLSRKGKLLSLVSAILAVATISLYKYDIEHFNSVEAEQVILHSVALLIFAVVAKIRTGENVFRYFKKRVFLAQSIFAGLSGIFLSYAYLFSVPSVITAVARSFEVLGAMVSGKTYFHEKHFGVKIVAFTAVAIGLLFLTQNN